MNVDQRALAELLEESQDLQADAMRPTHEALDELVEVNRAASPSEPNENLQFHEEHKRGVLSSLTTAPLLAAAGGLTLVGALASAASASSSQDIQILQTAASIENLAVATYKTALTLPYIGGASQTKPDPAFVPVVNKAVASLSGASAAKGTLGVVGLALELENIAAETYVKDTTLVASSVNKALFASVMGVEAQHVAVLLAVQALLNAGAPQLISLAPGTAGMLPAAAGSVGFPNAFYKTNTAAPATQGAVK